jgi:hypothetical protein
MFKGIGFKEFLDEADEWHALAIGFCETVCPWPPYFKCLSLVQFTKLTDERHYYYFGRVLGVFAWLGIAVIVKKLLF